MAIRRILVPVDFSSASLQALEYASEFRRPYKAELIVLHAVEPIYFGAVDGFYGGGFDASVVYREMERAAREQLAGLATTLRRRRIDVRVLHAVGPASQVIVDAAKKLDADLIIMSTHGRTGLAHVFMGSVAERVVRSAPCPVLTRHPDPDAQRRPRSLDAATPRTAHQA
jgi:nucleotide-binding universal stress UspA family protein